jgi:hypothetical protein
MNASTVIAFLDARHAGAHVDDDTGAFMTQYGGKQALRIVARAREFVGVAHARRFDFDQHFTGPRTIEPDGFDAQRHSRSVCNRGTHIHHRFLSNRCCSINSAAAK